jgi:hypothetical protein
MAPSVPKALELYLKMMEGLDFKWSVGSIGEPSIMNTPLARMAYSIEETVPCDRSGRTERLSSPLKSTIEILLNTQ